MEFKAYPSCYEGICPTLYGYPIIIDYSEPPAKHESNVAYMTAPAKRKTYVEPSRDGLLRRYRGLRVRSNGKR